MTDHENLISVPPDGGWGWVIVCVCFYAMIVIDVPALGFQVVQDELKGLLGLTAAQVSVFFSTYTMCMFLMGPVAGGVCNRFGFRLTTIIGCIFMIGGLGSSFFVSGYFEFLFLYGMMSGCGTSFILMMANVATGFWFESKRTIAIGLVSSASGATVFSVHLSNYVADKYGWRYCFATWAGLIFILLLASFLLAPPPMVELESDAPLVGPTKTVDVSRITNIIPLEYEKKRVQRRSEKRIRKISRTTGIPMGRVSRPSVTPAPVPVGFGRLFRCCLCCNCCQQSVGSRPIYRKDIFYEGSVYYVAKKENTDRTTFALTVSKLPTTKDVEEEVECHCRIPEAVTRGIKEMVDWTILGSPLFLLILASSVSVYVVRYIPFLVIQKFNLPFMNFEDASRTITMFGLGSVTARISVGFILYFFHDVSPLAATIFVTLTGGVTLGCLILSHEVLYQLILCFVGGALTAVVVTLRSLVIIDLLGLNKLTSCTGVLFFIQGFASFFGMPVAEFLKEKTGSYYLSMIYCGSGYVLAGIINIILLFVSIGMRKRRGNR